MMSLSKLLSRFRYPVSLPEDVARDLGVTLSNHLSFEEFIEALAAPGLHPKTLWKGMGRVAAEAVFHLALKKEMFQSTAFFSYYFNEGWVVVTLYFNEEADLTRVYVQCPGEYEGFELSLQSYYAHSLTQDPRLKHT